MPRSKVVAGALAAVMAVLLGAAPDGGSSAAAQTKTLKEQLLDKASDEQRVDNCGVPPERRGPTPRPDCADKVTTVAPAARPDGTVTEISPAPTH